MKITDLALDDRASSGTTAVDQAGFGRPREDALGEEAGQAAEVAEVERCPLPGVEHSQCSLAEHRAGSHSACLDMMGTRLLLVRELRLWDKAGSRRPQRPSVAIAYDGHQRVDHLETRCVSHSPGTWTCGSGSGPGLHHDPDHDLALALAQSPALHGALETSAPSSLYPSYPCIP